MEIDMAPLRNIVARLAAKQTLVMNITFTETAEEYKRALHFGLKSDIDSC